MDPIYNFEIDMFGLAYGENGGWGVVTDGENMPSWQWQLRLRQFQV